MSFLPDEYHYALFGKISFEIVVHNNVGYWKPLCKEGVGLEKVICKKLSYIYIYIKGSKVCGKNDSEKIVSEYL